MHAREGAVVAPHRRDHDARPRRRAAAATQRLVEDQPGDGLGVAVEHAQAAHARAHARHGGQRALLGDRLELPAETAAWQLGRQHALGCVGALDRGTLDVGGGVCQRQPVLAVNQHQSGGVEAAVEGVVVGALRHHGGLAAELQPRGQRVTGRRPGELGWKQVLSAAAGHRRP